MFLHILFFKTSVILVCVWADVHTCPINTADASMTYIKQLWKGNRGGGGGMCRGVKRGKQVDKRRKSLDVCVCVCFVFGDD